MIYNVLIFKILSLILKLQRKKINKKNDNTSEIKHDDNNNHHDHIHSSSAQTTV